MGYNDLGYQELHPDGYVKVPAREDLMLDAMKRWEEGHVRLRINALLPRRY